MHGLMIIFNPLTFIAVLAIMLMTGIIIADHYDNKPRNP